LERGAIRQAPHGVVLVMSDDVELRTASREQLLGVIAAQQATIAAQQTTITALEERVARLENRLGPSGKGMPGTKPAITTRSKATGRPRTRRAQGFARRRATPTQRVVHAATHCPDCGCHLLGGWEHRRREVIEIPAVPAQVVAHVIIARLCPRCRVRVLPADPLAGVVDGHQRLSTRVVSLIATLREEGRLPTRTIQWYLRTVHQLHLSLGAITDAGRRVAERGQAVLAQIRAAIRASPMVHADETGWRQNGVNGYVWTFCTPTDRYFVRRGRSKEVVDEVLGDTFAGILGCDFYAAYHHYPGLKQRCWAHLLREIHDLRGLYPKDVTLRRWAQAVQRLFKQAVAFTGADARACLRAQQRYEQRLLALCQPFLDDPAAVPSRLCRRIQRHLTELFVFVGHPAAPPDNNAAERSLRHLVTSRKISGGTRSAQGTDTKMALASLFGTWRVRGLDPWHTCRQLLASPQV
jgi:transposase